MSLSGFQTIYVQKNQIYFFKQYLLGSLYFIYYISIHRPYNLRTIPQTANVSYDIIRVDRFCVLSNVGVTPPPADETLCGFPPDPPTTLSPYEKNELQKMRLPIIEWRVRPFVDERINSDDRRWKVAPAHKSSTPAKWRDSQDASHLEIWRDIPGNHIAQVVVVRISILKNDELPRDNIDLVNMCR